MKGLDYFYAAYCAVGVIAILYLLYLIFIEVLKGLKESVLACCDLLRRASWADVFRAGSLGMCFGALVFISGTYAHPGSWAFNFALGLVAQFLALGSILYLLDPGEETRSLAEAKLRLIS